MNKSDRKVKPHKSLQAHVKQRCDFKTIAERMLRKTNARRIVFCKQRFSERHLIHDQDMDYTLTHVQL
jgi:hypothetical protein